MILFKKEFIEPIMAGEKTQTRRLWLNCRAKPGSFHWAQTTLKPDSRFARLFIIRSEEWDGVSISDDDAKAEGFDTAEEFWKKFNELNTNRKDDPRRRYYVVEFKAIEPDDVTML